MKYVIGIDLGTSGVKTVLFDTDGKSIAFATAEYPLYQPRNGWAEQDPNDWWRAVVKTLCEVTDKVGASCIAGIGLSGQMHGLVMLDDSGNPLCRSIIWCDQRTGEECRDIERLVGKERLIEITANPALTGFTASKLLWMRKHEGDTYAKAKHILLPKDYIRYKLTGEFATEVSDASGMQLLDIRNRCWSDEVLEKLKIDRALLGIMYESPEITGAVSSEAARLCKLQVGTPVVGGAGDNAAAAVGVGAVTNGSAFTTVGTSGVVFEHTDKLSIDPLGRVHTFCCAVPKAWHIMGVTQSAGLSLRWLRDTVCTAESAKALESGTDPYNLMSLSAEKSPIGANRLIYLPYLMGERTPHLDPNCRGAFVGLSAMHTRGDLIRAVMEGVCYSLCDCLAIFAEMNALPKTMYLCGGGARSDFWRAMLADCFGADTFRIQAEEGPALGAAILAMVGTGIYPSVESACKTIVKIKDKTVFSPANHSEYLKYYGIYKRLYGNLRESFNELAEINVI